MMVFKLPSALDRPVHALFPPKQIYERYTIGFTLVPVFLVILPMEGHMCGSERQIFYIFMVPPFRQTVIISAAAASGGVRPPLNTAPRRWLQPRGWKGATTLGWSVEPRDAPRRMREHRARPPLVLHARRARRAAACYRSMVPLVFLGLLAALLPQSGTATTGPAPTPAPAIASAVPAPTPEAVSATNAPTAAATWGGGGVAKFYCSQGGTSSRNSCPDGGMMSATYSKNPTPDPTWYVSWQRVH